MARSFTKTKILCSLRTRTHALASSDHSIHKISSFPVDINWEQERKFWMELVGRHTYLDCVQTKAFVKLSPKYMNEWKVINWIYCIGRNRKKSWSHSITLCVNVLCYWDLLPCNFVSTEHGTVYAHFVTHFIYIIPVLQCIGNTYARTILSKVSISFPLLHLWIKARVGIDRFHHSYFSCSL